jgi:hypothetical protein
MDLDIENGSADFSSVSDRLEDQKVILIGDAEKA